MKQLTQYIQEKLKINKDSKLKHDDLENYENDYTIDSFHKFFKLFMPFYGVNIHSKIEKELEKYFQDFPLYGYLLPQNNNQSDGHKLRKKLQLNDKLFILFYFCKHIFILTIKWNCFNFICC